MAQPLFKLGRTIFSVSHPDCAFEHALLELLRPCELHSLPTDTVYDVKFGITFAINKLFDELIKRHDRFLQLRAACLLSEHGQKVLISGAHASGKTTLALALMLGRSWKILSDSVTLLNRNENQILCFPSPINTKAGMRVLLQELPLSLPDFTLPDYMPVIKENWAEDCEGPFDLAVHLESGDQTLNCSSITSFQYLHKILPQSNFAEVDDDADREDDPDRFLTYLHKNNCYQFVGGSLKERVDQIVALCQTVTSKKSRPHGDKEEQEKKAKEEQNRVTLQDKAMAKAMHSAAATEHQVIDIEGEATKSTAWLPKTLLIAAKPAITKITLQDNLLVSAFGGQGGLLAISKGETPKVRFIDKLGSAGIWLGQREFVRAVYGGQMIVHIHRSNQVDIIANKNYFTVHDVRLHFGKLLVVSTGTNEVVMLDVNATGDLLRSWKFPGKGDTRHLNCLDLWDGRYVVSCFGRFEEVRQFKEHGQGAGIVFDLETDETLWDGLHYPHSPRMHNGRQYVCDSGSYRVLRRDGQSKEVQQIYFPGAFTRGIAFGEKHMYVGLSAIRAPYAGKQGAAETIATARVAIIDLERFELLDEINVPCSEIYEIVIPPADGDNSLAAYGEAM